MRFKTVLLNLFIRSDQAIVVGYPASKLSITATMSQAQIQTSAQVTTPEKYINTAAVSCNKRLNKTCLHSISHQQETQDFVQMSLTFKLASDFQG
jgi:hypothetical protein